MKYFIADTHFFHENSILLNKRPFQNVTEMNQKMIGLWNKNVRSKRDEIYILGDFVFGGTGKQANQILRQLNGRKFLIRGNHEKYLYDPEFDQNNFEWIKDYCSFKQDHRKFVLFHYPILEWDGYFNNSVLLYGHVHGTRQEYFDKIMGANAMNVGADLIDFAPISIDEVLKIITQKQVNAKGSSENLLD